MTRPTSHRCSCRKGAVDPGCPRHSVVEKLELPSKGMTKDNCPSILRTLFGKLGRR